MTPWKKTPWGIHLLLDIRGVNDVFTNDEKIEDFFDDLIVTLDMERLGPFVIDRVDDLDNQGWSAFQMITTSHLAMHGDELNNTLYIDVFSCKEFDVNAVLDLIGATFQSEHWNFHLIDRDASSLG